MFHGGQFRSSASPGVMGLHRRLQLVLLTGMFKTGGTPRSAGRPNGIETLGPPSLAKVLSSQFPMVMRLVSPKPQPLEWPTTLMGQTTKVARAIALARRGCWRSDTSFPVSRLHPVATVPGVALFPSCLPPPPIDFFYRISQLLFGFALCRFHLSFGLGRRPVQGLSQAESSPWGRLTISSMGAYSPVEDFLRGLSLVARVLAGFLSFFVYERCWFLQGEEQHVGGEFSKLVVSLWVYFLNVHFYLVIIIRGFRGISFPGAFPFPVNPGLLDLFLRGGLGILCRQGFQCQGLQFTALGEGPVV